MTKDMVIIADPMNVSKDAVLSAINFIVGLINDVKVDALCASGHIIESIDGAICNGNGASKRWGRDVDEKTMPWMVP